MQLSENFTLAEFEKSRKALKMNINNKANDFVIRNLKSLCSNILQPLRDEIGPITLSSGYRCPALNIAIGGARQSQHMFGEAADIYSHGYTAREIFNKIQEMSLNFDQLIYEERTDKKTKEKKQWVHISYKKNGQNRKKVMEIIK